MAVKVGKSTMGETPDEQMKLEKKRFAARQRRDEIEKQKHEAKIRAMDDGKNQKLI